VTIASSTTVDVARCRQCSTTEHVLPEGGRQAFNKLTDVTRMAVAGRREWTEDVSVIEARLA
jgi:hypothetical protein